VNRRILALWLPFLPTDRLLRRKQKAGSSAPDDLPLVIVAKDENALRLSAVDARAMRLGLFPGLSLSDARARVPALEVAEADEAADRALLEAVADWCDRLTPLVALDPPHGILLDISGCAHLFGSEQALMGEAVGRLRAQGFVVRTAIGGTAAAARALTRHGSNVIVAPGREAEAVWNLPIGTLEAEAWITAALKRAGLRTIGEVSARSRNELAARFGGGFVFLLDQALGKAGAPISPRRPLPDYVADKRFSEPVTTTEVIELALSSLAVTLESVLHEHGKGARQIEASFFRTDGAVRRITVGTSRPLKDANVVLRLFRERMNALVDPLDPGFGFDLIRLSAGHVEAFTAETVALDANDQEAHEIFLLVDHLAARYGAERVLRFAARDTHVPERVARAVPAQHAAQTGPWQQVRETGEAPRRPIRLLSRPEPIFHVMAEVPEGPPARFIWRRATHVVAHADGPERIAMEWWRTDRPRRTRDYFRVEDEEGKRFWLYREGIYGRDEDAPSWFLQGMFA
jgi:protein ImuB